MDMWQLFTPEVFAKDLCGIGDPELMVGNFTLICQTHTRESEWLDHLPC
jgi:hypothetical protein